MHFFFRVEVEQMLSLRMVENACFNKLIQISFKNFVEKHNLGISYFEICQHGKILMTNFVKCVDQ